MLTMYTDTYWGQYKKTRKSVACSVLMLGGNLLACCSRGQQLVAPSSGEAELGGAITGVAEGLFFKRLLDFFGIKVHLSATPVRPAPY